MRRTVDDALLALREQVKSWAIGAPADVRVLVYPPEWEAQMLDRLGPWSESCAASGMAVDLVDVGKEWLGVIDERRAEPALILEEKRSEERVLNSLRVFGTMAIKGALTRPLPEGTVARVLINTSALATTVSYSAITNEMYGGSAASVPVAIAFPGQADDRVLSLLGLRPDTNYRVPRI